MAIWQFSFFLVPEINIIKEHSIVPVYLEQYMPRHPTDPIDENKKFINYWYGIDSPIIRKNDLNLKIMKSWSEDMLIYKDDDDNKLEICDDDIECHINAMKPSIKLLKYMIDLAIQYKCRIVLSENGKVILPKFRKIMNYFNNSLAHRFVLDQENTLKSLKKHKFKIVK